MKIRQIPLFLATALMAAACDDDNVHDIIDNNLPADQKEAIAFSMSETGGARFGQSGTRAGFTAKTQIVARFESFKSLTVGATPAADAEKRTTRTVLEASVQEQASDESWYSPVVYKSDPSDNETDHIYKYKRFWDDSFSRLANISVYAVAVPQVSDPKNNNKTLEELVNYGGDNATKSNTVWKKDVEGNMSHNNITWTVTKGSRTESSISGQTSDLIAKEDLCYSNNIQADATLGKNGRYVYDFTTESYPAYSGIANKHEDGPLRIALKNTTDKTSQGHFDKGHLIFRHALTRLTIYLKKGAGFAAGAPFAFEKVGETDTNVKIYNVPVSNTLNIQTGIWQDNPTSGNIELMGGATAKDGFEHALMAQFVPGYVFTEGQTDTKVLEFTIDESTYYVSSAMIYTALATDNAAEVETIASKNAIKMKQGKNYVLEITVNKTGINNVTAELVDWETIKSTEIIPSNKYVNVVLEERGSSDHITIYGENDINKFDIYRKASTSSLSENTSYYNTFADYQWLTPYESAKATKEWDATNFCWKTGWFWPDNKTYYHLRVAGNDGATAASQTPVVNAASAAVPGDYFSIQSGDLVHASSSYCDYLWGAPFTDIDPTVKFKYTVENGFDQQTKDADEKVTSSQIYKAIGSTGDRINLMLFHMTSQVFFEVKTTTGNDKVALRTGTGTTDDPYQQTQVELLRFYKDGTVLMGTGKVDVSGELQSAQAIELKEHVPGTTTTGAKSTFQYGVVPQTLDRHTEGEDKNDYKIGIRITTPDGNQYVIQDISTVYATVSNNHLQNPYTVSTGTGTDTKYLIDRWYPGYKYTYSVTLKKTGIEKLTAQLVEWEEVSGVIKNGDNEEINLEGTD